MYRALYRKWRPKTFDEMVGQDHITSILKKQCEEDKVSHAYLFCGSRGIGKTSSAKILAKAVNCEHPINGNPCNECFSCKSIDSATATDVLEIDAASNNRVADVRELIDEVTYPPSLLKKRVYIIDEVHMLSDSAFNALLKTLEEPPEYVLFILATTELNQLPPTIISRCMRFDFKRIEPEVLAKRLHYVCEQEGINITEDAEKLIAKLADGAARDALSLLDACSAGRDDGNLITLEDVQAQLGITNNDTIINLFYAIVNRNIPEALRIVGDVHKSSKDLSVFMVDLITFVRDLLIAKSIPSESEKYLKEQFFFSASASDKLNGLLKAFTTETLLYYSSVLEDALNTVSRFTVNKKTFFELTVIKMCDLSLSENPKALLARIAELEKRVSEGGVVSTAAPVTDKPAIAPIPDAPVDKKKPAVEPIPSDTDEKPFKAFPEFVQEIKDHPDICSFVRMAKMTETGGEVIIYSDLLGMNILSQPAAKAVLESAVKSVTGKAKQVLIREKTGKEDNIPSLIDEIEL